MQEMIMVFIPIVIIEYCLIKLMFLNEKFVVHYINLIRFWFDVLCGLICYFTLGQRCHITQTTNDGEIIRQVFIGRR